MRKFGDGEWDVMQEYERARNGEGYYRLLYQPDRQADLAQFAVQWFLLRGPTHPEKIRAVFLYQERGKNVETVDLETPPQALASDDFALRMFEAAPLGLDRSSVEQLITERAEPFAVERPETVKTWAPPTLAEMMARIKQKEGINGQPG